MIFSTEKTPDYWEIISLGKICLKATKVKRKEVDIEKEMIYLDIGSIDNVTNRITEHKVYKWKDAPSRAQQIVQIGDILFSTVRVYLRNIAKVDNPLYEDQICSSGFTVIRGYRDCCDPKYLFAIALYEGFLQPLNELQTGTSYPAVRDSDVFSQLIPLPPLPEQRAIVYKIELLFSELDNGISNLKLAQEQLKVYRQAVLKKAFEGELTKKWREQKTDLPDAEELLEQIRKERDESSKTSGKKVKPLNPLSEEELAELARLPKGWKWVKIGYVSNCLDSQRVPVNKSDRIKRTGSIPYYGANGQVGWIDDYLFDEPLVLVVEDETFTGREKPFSYLITGKSWVNNHAHILQPTSGLDVDFLNYQLSYYPFTPLTTGTTGRKKLTQFALTNAPFKICSLTEQQAIVQEIETRLSVCDKIEQDIKENLEKAEALRQSILKKAFEGKLLNERELAEVRGAEDWEPTEVLLERIRAERVENGKNERTR